MTEQKDTIVSALRADLAVIEEFLATGKETLRRFEELQGLIGQKNTLSTSCNYALSVGASMKTIDPPLFVPLSAQVARTAVQGEIDHLRAQVGNHASVASMVMLVITNPDYTIIKK